MKNTIGLEQIDIDSLEQMFAFNDREALIEYLKNLTVEELRQLNINTNTVVDLDVLQDLVETINNSIKKTTFNYMVVHSLGNPNGSLFLDYSMETYIADSNMSSLIVFNGEGTILKQGIDYKYEPMTNILSINKNTIPNNTNLYIEVLKTSYKEVAGFVDYMPIVFEHIVDQPKKTIINLKPSINLVPEDHIQVYYQGVLMVENLNYRFEDNFSKLNLLYGAEVDDIIVVIAFRKVLNSKPEVNAAFLADNSIKNEKLAPEIKIGNLNDIQEIGGNDITSKIQSVFALARTDSGRISENALEIIRINNKIKNAHYKDELIGEEYLEPSIVEKLNSISLEAIKDLIIKKADRDDLTNYRHGQVKIDKNDLELSLLGEIMSSVSAEAMETYVKSEIDKVSEDSNTTSGKIEELKQEIASVKSEVNGIDVNGIANNKLEISKIKSRLTNLEDLDLNTALTNIIENSKRIETLENSLRELTRTVETNTTEIKALTRDFYYELNEGTIRSLNMAVSDLGNRVSSLEKIISGNY